MVKNLPVDAGDVGSTLGLGAKIPHPMGQLSQLRQVESASPRACALQEETPPDERPGRCSESPLLPEARESPCTHGSESTMKTQGRQK